MSRADDDEEERGIRKARRETRGRKEKTFGHERVIIIAGGKRLFLVPLALSRSFLLPRTRG